MNKVVVSGLGSINALGGNTQEFFANLVEGKDGIAPIRSFEVNRYRCTTGGEVPPGTVMPHLPGEKPKRTDRAAKLLFTATQEALSDAGLERMSESQRQEMPLLTGTTLGGMLSGEQFYREWHAVPGKANPSPLLEASQHAANDRLMAHYDFQGPSLIFSTACSASAHAIGYGFELIRSGRKSVVLAGGFEVMSELAFSGFHILRSLTSDKIRPFDKRRSGLVLGEGAGMLVLEEYEQAKARGAEIYAELAGYGSSCDAHHMTAPHPKGRGAALAIRQALHNAQLNADSIDYVCAHGTGTSLNDAAETQAIKESLGSHAFQVPVSSIKSMIGHLLGGAGAAGAIAACMSIRQGAVPPTINLEEADPKCDLDYVPGAGRNCKVNAALCNSFGFGGNNGVLALKKVA